LNQPADADLKQQAARLLTDLTATVLGKKRELTAVTVEPVDPASWFIGGEQVETGTFSLDIKVTEGTNTKNEKAEYVRQVFLGLEALLGPLAPASYVVIHEVRGDAWGYQAQTQERRYIQGRSL
jgi:4-oxalocrotonate tautomerase